MGFYCLVLAALAIAHHQRTRSCRDKKNCKVVFSQEELRKRLTPLQYHVTQEKGTESAFEGEYTHHKDPGIYKCVVCGTPLFNSGSKENLLGEQYLSLACSIECSSSLVRRCFLHTGKLVPWASTGHEQL
ncbi:hypothetical protein FD755_010585 [Muntiacus reevesi]|uniref:L-methionine (R)-S-oxide reductase n=1 Tax=Muntiacus reevesi TaxID=9886 RepID=A0A5N3Y093_MUNRE|nr:hypothetical protein FD755_010585 [Muntiacus reevesi]